jgi:hypothetical protein
MSIDALYSEIEQTQAVWKEMYDLLLRAQYDTKSPRAVINNVSVEAFHRRVELAFELLYGIRPSNEDDLSWLTMSVRSAEITPVLNNFKVHAQSSLNFLRQYWRDNLTIRDANNNFTWQLYEGDSNIANQEVSTNFGQMQTSLNQLTTIVGQLLPLCKTAGIADLSARAQAMGDVIREIEGLRNEAKKLAKSAEQGAAGAAEKEKAAQALVAQAEAAYAKLQALQQQSTTDSASVTALVTQIKTTGASAQTLEQQVEAYKVKFEAFHSELDDRLEQFSHFEINTKAALIANAKRETEIQRLMDKADTMIRGSTTAGLSFSLDKTQELYYSRMFWARVGFLMSILFLTVSALPLAAHLLPGLFGDLVSTISEGAQSSPVGVLGKIILLFPSTWLTLFFAKSYSEFFHLEREYGHKASLAKSVEGFKREAPLYKEEMTASVFGEILSNPSNRKSPDPVNHPIYEVITKHLVERFKSKKEEV